MIIKILNHYIIFIKTLFLIFLYFSFSVHASDDSNITLANVVIPTTNTNIKVAVKHWKAFRDEGIIKQALDYSCGAASLATLLNGFYNQTLTEAEVLEAIDKGEFRASFQDMQKALPKFGFKAQGFAATFEQLSKLKIPVIVYLKHRKTDHFSVVKGIDEDTVWLADPSLGNRTYSKAQFLSMWNTRVRIKKMLTFRVSFSPCYLLPRISI